MESQNEPIKETEFKGSILGFYGKSDEEIRLECLNIAERLPPLDYQDKSVIAIVEKAKTLFDFVKGI